MGSVALGAFILALVQLVRLILEYIDRHLRGHGKFDTVARWALCCLRCCMWCVEQFVKFLNRNAYIMVGSQAGRAAACAIPEAGGQAERR